MCDSDGGSCKNSEVGLNIDPPGAIEARAIDFHAVSQDYFRVMGIQLLRGRLFGRFDPKADKGAILINRERRKSTGQDIRSDGI